MGSERVIVIGGSAGSFPVLIAMLKQLPVDFPIPIVIVLHRQRNVISEMNKILGAIYQHKQIIEPDDKDAVNDCCIYLAPQNYHLLFELDKTFSLDYSEVVKYSRPSIDVTFESAALVYGSNTIGILLSGANNDGAHGMRIIKESGGITIAQDPASAEYPFMPAAAIEQNTVVNIFSPEQITSYLCGLTQ
jgi:two-component system, chemotaxis family, protein-glutamate methylesterase/glutaminase